MRVRHFIRVLLTFAVVLTAVTLGVFAYLNDPTPRVLIPQLSGIVACAGALLVWNFLGLNRRVFIFFLLLSLLYVSVPLIRLAIGSDLRYEEFFIALEATCAAFVPVMFFWFAAAQTRRKGVRFFCKGLVYLLTALLVLFPGSLWAYFIAMKQLLTSDIILAFAQTNGDESYEYFSAHANIYWLFAWIFAFALVGFFIFVLRRTGVGQCRHFRGRFECGILLAVLSLYELVNVIPSVPYLATSVLKITGNQLKQYERYSKSTAEREKRLADIGAIWCKKDHAGIYVLVIGESVNRDHMQIYGYERKDTPFMEELSKDQNTFVFDRPYASFPQTVPAITYALTGKNQYNGADLVDSFSILEVARKAGFEIYWLSNQRKIGVYETPISVISSAADHEIFLNNTAKMYSLFHDEELIDCFPDLKDKENALIIVHLMGSHARYAERTPDDRKVYSGSKDVRIDDYDSSILYTDDNLRRIYDKVRDHPRFKAFVYVSDHGEDLDTQFDHNPADFTFPMVRIPLVVSVSKEYASRHKGITQALRSHKTKIWTNDLTFDLMCGLMGLSGMPQYEASYDLSSASYKLSEKKAVTMHGERKITEDPRFGR